MNDLIKKLEVWYNSQLNESWEHDYGIKIQTLDNPGWSVEINLKETNLENKAFFRKCKGVDYISNTTEDKWIDCKVENNKFLGNGNSLEEILTVFFIWQEANS